MALQRILVVHDSPAVRETVGILLAGEYDVHAMEADQYLARRAIEPAPDLLIAAAAIAARPLPEGMAVLWVEEPDARLPPGPRLPQGFSPRELRRQVAAALARPAAPVARDAPRARIEPPFVPPDAARVLAEAVRSALPLHLAGEPGVGKRAVARAVHGSGTPRQLLCVDAGELAVERALATAGLGTLYLTRVDAAPRPVQDELLGALTPGGTLIGADGGTVRLITASTGDLADALEGGALLPELYYRLTLLTARLPPLRERPDDVPALAQQLAGELARALGRPPAVLTERALERLRNYLWFGNVTELEAVLARSLALTRQPLLDADDLLFDGGRLPRERARAADAAGQASLGAQQLDLIINELAHEFKNPLVTLKTFAHHLRRSAGGGEDAEQVARLTGEAVAQIDHTLENLLEFTRLDGPAVRPVPLAELLDPALEECRFALAARGVHLEHEPLPAVPVSADPQHVTYALGNLLRALARDLARDSVVRLGVAPPATLHIRLPDDADPLGNHLATLLDRSDVTTAPPLGVAIANAVLDRNGAHVAVAAEDPRMVVIRFTVAEDAPQEPAHGSSPRTGR